VASPTPERDIFEASQLRFHASFHFPRAALSSHDSRGVISMVIHITGNKSFFTLISFHTFCFGTISSFSTRCLRFPLMKYATTDQHLEYSAF